MSTHSSTLRRRRKGFAAAVFITAGVAFGLASCTSAYSANTQGGTQPTPPTIFFDVAEDISRFAFDPDFADSDGMPRAGAAFVTTGYLYPADTLSAEADGVNDDGSPQFPDKAWESGDAPGA